MLRNTLCVFSASLLLSASPAAKAEVIVSATSATTDMGEAFAAGTALFSLVNAIDQAGLSPTYVSGVTDFTTYLAGGPLHTSLFGTDFVSINSTGNIDFNLGSVKTIDAAAVWNFGPNNPTFPIQDVHLYGSLDPSFSSPIDLGAFTLANPGDNLVLAQVLDFSATSLQYLRMTVLSNYGWPSGSALGQIAFAAQSVPEPSTFAMLVLGGLVFGFVARKRR